MSTETLDKDIQARVAPWLCGPFDDKTQKAVRELLEGDIDTLTESFYTDLEFGTGGLRGKMGVGTNRVNKYTIGLATQGLANYLKISFPNQDISVAVAFDSRNNSQKFAGYVADVLSGNGIVVHLFPELRPTPILSYAVRALGCQSGIVITASHNPPIYNGYKVYWEDGGQVIAPHDAGIISEVRKLTFGDVVFVSNPKLIQSIGASLDDEYLRMAKSKMLSPETMQRNGDISIVYTSLHGTGITLVPKALANHGFSNVNLVEAQSVPNGDFPTVTSPNPEESQALDMGLKLCEKIGADLLLGTDPDADRVGIAVRDAEGKMVLLNGNETGSLLVFYHLQRLKELGKLDGRQFVAKTVVTTELIAAIANGFNVELKETLTGFKWIRLCEGKLKFVTGGEESYGYLIGDEVRDKDAVLAAVMLSEITAWAKSKGQTLVELLRDIHLQYGYYREGLLSITREGISGKAEIVQTMEKFRTNPPKTIDGSEVVEIRDLLSGESLDLLTGSKTTIHLPSSNVLQFITKHGAKITVRPSGTEPKIKYYFSLNAAVTKENYAEVQAQVEIQLKRLEKLFAAF
jgi:phosphoglucomutase